jgi:hypothetical protein
MIPSEVLRGQQLRPPGLPRVELRRRLYIEILRVFVLARTRIFVGAPSR